VQQPRKVNPILHPKPVNKSSKVIKQPVPKSVDFWLNHKISISKAEEEAMKEMRSKVTTSKLEFVFMREFLNKLGCKYIHQFPVPAKFIYDFCILTPDGNDIQALIEVDGDFYHRNPKTMKDTVLYENQRKQIIRDKAKDDWAAFNGFVLLRFWENDIKNNPKIVLQKLKKHLITGKK
jgi:very-short-patch-repair endonuclease